MDERLDDADAAVVGRVVAERTAELNGLPQRYLTVEVEQRVKGDVARTLEVRGPAGNGLRRRRAPRATSPSGSCSRARPTEPG